MKLCYACTQGQTCIGLAHTGEWINLSQVFRAYPEQFPWLEAHPEPALVDLLENTPDLLETMRYWLNHLQETGALASYRLQEPLQLLAPVTRPCFPDAPSATPAPPGPTARGSRGGPLSRCACATAPRAVKPGQCRSGLPVCPACLRPARRCR